MVEGTRFTQLGKLFWREFREHLQFILEKIVDVVIQWFRTVGLFCLSDVRVTISPHPCPDNQPVVLTFSVIVFIYIFDNIKWHIPSKQSYVRNTVIMYPKMSEFPSLLFTNTEISYKTVQLVFQD